MNHFSIKDFIFVSIVNFLALKNIKCGPNQFQITCVHNIKVYYEMKPNDSPIHTTYINYAMKHFRKSVETIDGFQIIPSKVGKPQMIPQGSINRSQGGSFNRGPPQIVYDLKDLMGNTAANKNTSDAGGSSSNSSQRGHLESDTAANEITSDAGGSSSNSSQRGHLESGYYKKIVVDYLNIPEDVKLYYLEFIPYLTSKAMFLPPALFCIKNIYPDCCTRQILESFNITVDHKRQDIIIKLYENYVIGELFSASQEYAILYLKHVAANTKVQEIKGRDSMPSANRFCQIRYPASTYW